MMMIGNVGSIFSKTQSTLMTRMHTKSRMQPNSLNLFKKITIIRLGTLCWWWWWWMNECNEIASICLRKLQLYGWVRCDVLEFLMFRPSLVMMMIIYFFFINYDYDDVYNVENQYLFECEKNNENCGSFSSWILIFLNDWNVQCDAQELLKFKGSWSIMTMMTMAMMTLWTINIKFKR